VVASRAQARGAETKTLTRETHDDALGALWTRQDREASRKHATIDVTLELILHERGQWCSETLLGGGIERAQVVAHDLVQGALLRTPPRVRWLAGHSRGLRNRRARGRSVSASRILHTPGVAKQPSAGGEW